MGDASAGTAVARLQRVRSIDEVLAEARSRITRFLPEEAAARMAAGALMVETDGLPVC